MPSTEVRRPGMYRKPQHERRAEQQRIIDDTADRLQEVLTSWGISSEVVPRQRLLEDACYVAGYENDYIEDES